MPRLRLASPLLGLLALALTLDLAACRKSESTPPSGGDAAAGETDPFAGREVVDNPSAKPGDVTVCPYSGRKFEVKADSPKIEHGGVTYVLCSEKARDEVAKDPERYLGGGGAQADAADAGSSDADASDDEPDQGE
ncbi:MAG: hypothetical protein KC420_20390 [Myxococcales bacterium]|nr:hypothetical protein [Myxococcales bacterium]MCB9570046.1 hypothetical protein [Myxococcales bacterium]MCB9701875.1 hypothetical protein [Myxococcales bacterium]